MAVHNVALSAEQERALALAVTRSNDPTTVDTLLQQIVQNSVGSTLTQVLEEEARKVAAAYLAATPAQRTTIRNALNIT